MHLAIVIANKIARLNIPYNGKEQATPPKRLFYTATEVEKINIL